MRRSISGPRIRRSVHGRCSIRRTNRTGLEFCLADIAPAFTMIDRSGVMQDRETRRRNIGHAREAHAVVTVLSQRLDLTPEEGESVEQRLHALRERIDSVAD